MSFLSAMCGGKEPKNGEKAVKDRPKTGGLSFRNMTFMILFTTKVIANMTFLLYNETSMIPLPNLSRKVQKMSEQDLRTFDFGDQKHFSLLDTIKELIRDGNVEQLDELLCSSDYLNDLEHIFFNDVSLAIASFEYVWAQSSYVAIEEGVDAAEAGRLYEFHRRQLLNAQSVAAALYENRQFHRALTTMVWAIREESAYSPLVQSCRHYVREHILEPPSVQDVADHLNISRGHLSQLFKKETGQTVREFIRALRLAEIIEFLEDPAVPDSEVWQLTGFCSQSHYIHFFKTMTGQTPKQFTMEHAREAAAPLPAPGVMDAGDFRETRENEAILEQLDDYAEKGGFKQQLYLLYCVRRGKVEDLRDELKDPRFRSDMRSIFQGNRTMVLETLLYLLPQISAAAVDAGVSMKSASRIYIDIIKATPDADADQLLDLLVEAYLDYAQLVVESKDQ